METNIFEKLIRNKVRFDTQGRGELTAEQVYDLPLESKSNVSLDSLARLISKRLREETEESFVSTRANPLKASLELQLEFLKHVIQCKIKEAEDKKNRAAAAERKQKILEALDRADQNSLANKSVEELQAELRSLEQQG